MDRRFHVHLVEATHPFWGETLRFRDYLRKNDAVAREYAALKRALAVTHCDDRAAYTEAKAPFITKSLGEARRLFPRIHVLGAAGRGVTTFGRRLAERFGVRLFEVDDFYWQPTNPPFQKPRLMPGRMDHLVTKLSAQSGWILSGTMDSWAGELPRLFDLVIFVTAATDLRIQRGCKRAPRRFGDALKSGGPMHDYDDGGMSIESRLRRETWLKSLPNFVLRLDGSQLDDASAAKVAAALESKDLHLTS